MRVDFGDDHVSVSISSVTGKHAKTHEAGGNDPINVTNLPGVLSEPQKIYVQHLQNKKINAKELHFSGSGVNVSESNGNAIVNISNVTGKHAQTHEADGNDPINVTNLPGVLSAPQKVYVQHLQKKINAKELHFSGSGVNVSESNGNAHVNISGGNSLPVLSGTVVFTTIGDGMAHSSPDIKLKIEDPAIILALEDPEKNIMMVEMGAGVEHFEQYPTIRAFYDKEKAFLNIYLYEQAESNPDVKWIVRWWAVPKTEEMDQVEGKPIDKD